MRGIEPGGLAARLGVSAHLRLAVSSGRAHAVVACRGHTPSPLVHLHAFTPRCFTLTRASLAADAAKCAELERDLSGAQQRRLEEAELPTAPSDASEIEKALASLNQVRHRKRQ